MVLAVLDSSVPLHILVGRKTFSFDEGNWPSRSVLYPRQPIVAATTSATKSGMPTNNPYQSTVKPAMPKTSRHGAESANSLIQGNNQTLEVTTTDIPTSVPTTTKRIASALECSSANSGSAFIAILQANFTVQDTTRLRTSFIRQYINRKKSSNYITYCEHKRYNREDVFPESAPNGYCTATSQG